MAPVVHGLEADYAGKIEFVYLDTDDAATKVFADQLNSRGQPRFFLLDGGGNVVLQWSGSVGKADFVSAFDSLIAASGG